MVKKIHSLILILFVLSFLGFVGCSDDDDDDSSGNFAQADIVGDWKGTAKNSSNTITLNLSVSSSGKVTGSGVSSTWTVASDGKVTGGGSFSFVAGSSYISASASWDLQLSEDKTSLTGKFDVSYSSLHSMTVNLTKQ